MELNIIFILSRTKFFSHPPLLPLRSDSFAACVEGIVLCDVKNISRLSPELLNLARTNSTREVVEWCELIC